MSRYTVQRRELEVGHEHGFVTAGWFWLILDRRTGDYAQGFRFDTREEALAMIELAGLNRPPKSAASRRACLAAA